MEEISVMELLQRTADMIGEISVPVSLGNQIARPLCQAVENLQMIIDFLKEQPKEGEKRDV